MDLFRLMNELKKNQIYLNKFVKYAIITNAANVFHSVGRWALPVVNMITSYFLFVMKKFGT